MVRGWFFEDFRHYLVVYFDRVDQFLPVRFVIDFECRPPRTELYFPAQLSVAREYICFTFVSASLQGLAVKFCPLASVPYHVTFRNVFECLGCVDASTASTDGKVGKRFGVLLLPK